MKRLIVAALGVSAVVAAGWYMSRTKPMEEMAGETLVQPVETISHEARPAPSPRVARPGTKALLAREQPVDESAAAPGQSNAILGPKTRIDIEQAVEMLLAPGVGYEARQLVWKRIRTAEKLDEAIAILEQRVAGDPRDASAVAILGEGYYKKAGQTEDVRESAILAMKADQTLQTALEIDPSNWDARFTKAVGMSYWPADLKKGPEVIEQLSLVIEHQEAQPSEPHFARCYVRLGEQYEKAGKPDYAAQTWRRGAALFPNDEDLRAKLTPAP